MEIDDVVEQLAEITSLEKEIKSKKENLRSELFEIGADDYEGKEWLLPTTTITVPKEFWVRTNLTPDEFIASRFPTWDLESREDDVTMFTTTFVLRKKPLYMPYKYENDNYKLSKSVTEPTPEIDWETLKAEDSQIFDKITKEVVIYELDGEALEELMAEDDSIIPFLTRHTMYKREPQQRVGIKNV
jgi:hypothetical protein